MEASIKKKMIDKSDTNIEQLIKKEIEKGVYTLAVHLYQV